MEHGRFGRLATGAAVLLGTLVAANGWASMEVTAPNGRRVLLKEDYTWEYVTEDASERYVLLSVVNRHELANACRFGLRLTNHAGVKVQSLVPQFSAYTREGVVFETVFAAFNHIKPTLDQYQEITFRGIRCDDIARISVHGADRCSVGDLTKFSPETGKCLQAIRVEESPIVSISK
jgi:hypothetical protein